MLITPVFNLPQAMDLWENNMHEAWADYKGADMFAVLDGNNIVGGFAVYCDNSDGISGTFCSGWAKHRGKVPTGRIIKQIAKNYGDLYFKTDRRPAKILLEKIGKRIKNVGPFGYYIVNKE